MKDRIKLIMERENLMPAKFADKLQINRAIISHILNGRNNPSLDVVTKILNEMDYINAEWLLNGTGKMYKEGFSEIPMPSEPNLFTQVAPDAGTDAERTEKSEENDFKQAFNRHQLAESQPIEQIKNNTRQITQIIIYYNDNTFEVFNSRLK